MTLQEAREHACEVLGATVIVERSERLGPDGLHREWRVGLPGHDEFSWNVLGTSVMFWDALMEARGKAKRKKP